jgi:GNAT superfamily N-acetyltransferase
MTTHGAAAHDPIDPTAVLPEAWERRTRLRDGTHVLLRQIRPEDRQRLAEGLRRLSPASRYLRFHAAIDQLSDTQLDYLTDVDHHDHEAIVAVDLDRPGYPGIGVARFIREPFEPEVAEAAITVADEYHGQGAGTLLLGALAGRAREEGVAVFRNYVLEGNHGMLEVFDHLGAHRERETDGLWRVDLDVPEDEHHVPDSGAGRAFLEIARAERTLASLFPPVWSRWRRRRDDGGTAEDDTGELGPFPDVVASEFEELREELDSWLQHRHER